MTDPGFVALVALLVVACEASSSAPSAASDAWVASDADAVGDAAPDAGGVAGDAGDAAGDGGDAGGTAGCGFPLDEVLRLDHLQVKGTHNSYHVAPEPLGTPEWDYTHAPLAVQLAEQGVRQVELDVHWDAATGGFRVHHIPLLDDRTTCETFAACLGELRAWSDANRCHLPLFVLVEPKSPPVHDHYDALDAAALAAWPRERVLTPDELRGDHATLADALVADGWPTLAEARGRVLFVLLDKDEGRDRYLADRPNLEGRAMFLRSDGGVPYATFVEIGNVTGREDEARALVAAGYLLRTASDSTDPERVARNPERAAAALASGAHLISTDFPAPSAAGDDGWWFDVGDGRPARCNPLTAPPECAAAALE